MKSFKFKKSESIDQCEDFGCIMMLLVRNNVEEIPELDDVIFNIKKILVKSNPQKKMDFHKPKSMEIQNDNKLKIMPAANMNNRLNPFAMETNRNQQKFVPFPAII